MKHSGKMLFCLLAAIASGTGAYAISTDSPYQGIAVRNVFGLRAPPAPETNQVVSAPPVKIIPSGVTDILGKKLVLLKIQVPAKPPMAASEQSHIMGIGDRQGEVEVVDIDEKAGVIKFKNHGIEVTLSLEKDGAKLPNSPTPAAPGAPGAPGAPNAPGAVSFVPHQAQPQPGATSFTPVSGSGVNNYGNSSAGLQGIPSRSVRTSGNPIGGGGFGNPLGGGYAAPTQPNVPQVQLSHEEQMIMMEVEREMNKNNPRYPPPPPTPITPGGAAAVRIPQPPAIPQ